MAGIGDSTALPFAEAFTKPTVGELLEYSAPHFEKFTAYVFSRAGYLVENVATQFGLGIDLKIYLPDKRRPVAYVQVKRYKEDHLVGSPAVLGFLGSLTVGRVPGYLVTTSDFTKPAYRLAPRHCHLVDGAHLLRYITYVGGSRHELSTGNPVAPDYLYRADEIVGRRMGTTRILTIANNKGGVGKTTTALNLAAGLAAKGVRVLLVDLDAQANLSGMLFRSNASELPAPNLVNYFAQGYPLTKLIQRTPLEGVKLLSAHPDLRLLDKGGSARPEAELKFVESVRSLMTASDNNEIDMVDWVVIDTPPAMSTYTRCALASADYVLCPAVCDAMAIDGLFNLFQTLRATRALMGGGAKLIGGLVTRWEERSSAMQHFYEQVSDLFRGQGSHVLDTKIPLDRNIGRTQAEELRVLGAAKKLSPAAAAYETVVEEVLHHVGNN